MQQTPATVVGNCWEYFLHILNEFALFVRGSIVDTYFTAGLAGLFAGFLASFFTFLRCFGFSEVAIVHMNPHSVSSVGHRPLVRSRSRPGPGNIASVDGDVTCF